MNRETVANGSTNWKKEYLVTWRDYRGLHRREYRSKEWVEWKLRSLRDPATLEVRERWVTDWSATSAYELRVLSRDDDKGETA